MTTARQERASALADSIIRNGNTLTRPELVALLELGFASAVDDEIGDLASGLAVQDRERTELVGSLREARDVRVQLERELQAAHATGAHLQRSLSEIRTRLHALGLLGSEHRPVRELDARLFGDSSPYGKVDPRPLPPLECGGAGEFEAFVFDGEDEKGHPTYTRGLFACPGCKRCKRTEARA